MKQIDSRMWQIEEGWTHEGWLLLRGGDRNKLWWNVWAPDALDGDKFEASFDRLEDARAYVEAKAGGRQFTI